MACVNAQETGWPPGARLSVMTGLSTHIVQKLNIGTVFSTLSNMYVLFS